MRATPPQPVLLRGAVILLLSRGANVRLFSPASPGAGGGVVDAQSTEFNTEINRRIHDRLSFYMSAPVETNALLSNLRYSGAFPHDLRAPDRDAYLVVDNALPAPLVYYGLEDGSIAGFYKGGSSSMGYYREPGDAAYLASDPTMELHYKSCVNGTDGTPAECTMGAGESYVRCVDNCTLLPCPDEDSQRSCPDGVFEDEAEAEECRAKQKLCVQYEIASVPDDGVARGYIPFTSYCHDVHGLFTQEAGAAVKGYTPSSYDLAAVVRPDGSSSVHELGSCHYADGTTLVNRTLAGAYAHCGTDGEVCDGTFAGGYESNEYDPRYRPWYIGTKTAQMPVWQDPYPFFDLGMGITHAHPIYDYSEGEDGRKQTIFAGVLAVDYRFEDIAQFISESYGNTSALVAVVEDKEPHYLIALSTGTPVVSLVLSADTTKPCPVTEGQATGCEPVRIAISNLLNEAGVEVRGVILAKSFEVHKSQNFPEELLTAKTSDAVDAPIYVSQSTLYEQPGANLRWRIVVASPGGRSDVDSVERGDPLFPAVLAVGAAGVLVCAAMFGLFYAHRREKAVIYSDYRFTCAFIGGCALFNSSTLVLVGPNTDGLCLGRMWTFHLLLAAALAPLLVKVWRMWMLVGQASIKRVRLPHRTTALYTLPIVGAQVVILLAVTLADPPRATERTEIEGSAVTRQIVCSHDTKALLISEIVYEACLVLAGCALAFLCRNLDKRYGESKQLIFAMYNIALVGVVFVIVGGGVTDVDQQGRIMLQAVGVFWGSVFSSAAFVVPRLVQVKQDDATTSMRRHSTRVSGVSRLSGDSLVASAVSRRDSCESRRDSCESRRDSCESLEASAVGRKDSCESLVVDDDTEQNERIVTWNVDL